MTVSGVGTYEENVLKLPRVSFQGSIRALQSNINLWMNVLYELDYNCMTLKEKNLAL